MHSLVFEERTSFPLIFSFRYKTWDKTVQCLAVLDSLISLASCRYKKLPFLLALFLFLVKHKKKKKIHCKFLSSQADGPMCRPDIVLPEQTSDEEFQVLLVVIKIIVETFIGATVYPLGILGTRPMVFLVK